MSKQTASVDRWAAYRLCPRALTDPGTSISGARPEVRPTPSGRRLPGRPWVVVACVSLLVCVGLLTATPAAASGPRATPADDARSELDDAVREGTSHASAEDPAALLPPRTFRERRLGRRNARWSRFFSKREAKAKAKAEPEAVEVVRPSDTDDAPVWSNRWSRAFVPIAEADAQTTVTPAPRVLSLGSVEGSFQATPAAPGTLAMSTLAPPPADPTAPETAEPEDDNRDNRRRRDAQAPTLLRKAGVPPFWIEREYDTHTTKAVAFPPFFVHRTPKPDHPERFLHLTPLSYAWYSKSKQRRRAFSPLLFFGGFSERKSQWAFVPLLMGYRRLGEQYNFGQFPLVWAWGTKFVRNLLVAPFHYQQKAPDGYRGVSALLLWYGHRNLQDADIGNDKRHFVAAPVFWRFSRGLKTFDFALLYIGGENKLSGLEHRTVFPLFLWQSREFGNHRELWTLPFIRRRDSARRMAAWAVPPALTFKHEGPDRSLLSATPLFWRGDNRLKGSRFTMAGLFGRYVDPRQSSTFVAPVWFRFTDRERNAATNLIVPLGVTRRTGDRLAVYSLLGGGGKTKDGWAAFALPVLGAAGRTGEGTKYQGALGVLWHVDRPATEDAPRRNTFVLGPAAYAQIRGSAEGRQTRIGIPPLLTFGQFGGPKRYQVVTPLLWHVREKTADRDRRTLVAAGLYHHRLKTAEGSQMDGGLPPLFFYGNGVQRRYAVVPWLLTGDFANPKDDTRLTLSPLYVRSSSPTHRTQGFAGIAWDVQYAGERHSVVAPLYYRRQVGDRTLTLTPVGARFKRGNDIYAVFGPYARRRVAGQDGAGILPIAWWDRRTVEGGTATHLVVAPLLLHRRTPTDDFDMWTPLVWRRNVRIGKPRKNLAVVPFYFRQRQAEGVDVDAGLGFFYSRDDRRRTHTLVAGPAFHRLSRKGLHSGVAPLYWWHDSETKRRLIALPTIIHVEDKAKDQHTTIAAPFWFDRQLANGRRAWGAFPFLFGGRRLHNFTRFSVAPPGYFDIFRLQRNTRFTGHAPLLFRYQKCGFQTDDDPRCQYTLWGSAPFFLYGKDGHGRRTHGSLVYYWDRRPEGWRIWTPVFGLTNHPGDLLAWYAGPAGVRTSQTHRRVFAFPLYYRKKHRLQDSSLTLVAPPVFVSRRREDRRFFEAGLVLWQFRELHRVSTAVLPPVFFHSYSYKQRRMYWVAPLFYRDNNMGKDRTFTAIAPALYTQVRRGENLDFVQFPLVWHIERGANQGTFGAFLWWDIRVKDKLFQLVPGAYARWADKDKDTKIVGPFLGWWSKGKGEFEGDRHWRALFGVFGAGVENGRKYRAILGRKIDAGAAPAVSGEASGGASVRGRGGATTPEKPKRVPRRIRKRR